MRTPTVQTDNRQGNLPLYSLTAVILFVAFGVTGAVVADNDNVLQLMIGLIITTVPSLIAAAFAERASRDIRNGVVKDKVKEGLHETGVSEMARLNPDDIRRINALLLNLQSEDDKRVDLRSQITRKENDDDGR